MQRKYFIATIFFHLIFLSVPSFASEEIWVDVRSLEEFSDEHLAKALHIPHTNIVNGIKTAGIAKSTTINLYCRSGRRAELARIALAKAGYTNVINAGGLQALLAPLPQ